MPKNTFTLTFAALSLLLSATAQEVKISGVKISEPLTPVYQGEDGSDTILAKGTLNESTGVRKWFRISAEYETGAEWTDQLTLEYYVLFPGGKQVFKGTVSYIDIPRGRNHLSEMYMHFNSYARHYKHGTVHYAVVALLNGRQVSLETSKKTPENWWKELPAHPCGLLDRNMTPFSVLNVEKFEAQNHRAW
jgi:hypothetical protein